MCNNVRVFSSFEILQHEILVEYGRLKTEKREATPQGSWEWQNTYDGYSKYNGWNNIPTASMSLERPLIGCSAIEHMMESGGAAANVYNANIRFVGSDYSYVYYRVISNANQFIFLNSDLKTNYEEINKIREVKINVNSSDIDVIFMKDGYEDVYVPKIRYDFMKDDTVFGEYYLYPQVGTIPFGISGWDKYNGVYDHAVIDSSKVNGNNYVMGVNKVSTTPSDTSIKIELSNEWSALDTPVSSFTIPEIPKSTEATEENIRALFNK